MQGGESKPKASTPSPSQRSAEHRASSGRMLGALAIAAAISVVVASIWVLSSDGGAASGSPGSPTPAASPPSGNAADDLDERTVYLWDPDTGEVATVFSAPLIADFELSPAGGLLVYERGDVDSTTQIYVLDGDGNERRLTDLPRGASDPTWSPDGRIAFVATSGDISGVGTDTDIFVMESDGSHVRRLAGTGSDDAEPHWSPAGSRIAFHSRPSVDDPGSIWVASARNRSIRLLTGPRNGSAMDAAWSPDGRWIAYSRYWAGNTLNGLLYNAQLWLMHADGTGKHPIAKRSPGTVAVGNPGRVSRKPSWSPDGRLIVFGQAAWDGGQPSVNVIHVRTGRTRPFLSSTRMGQSRLFPPTPRGEWTGFDQSWSSEGILLVQRSAAPSPQPLSLSAVFGTAPLGGPGIDATITMTGARCELNGYRRVSGGGTLRLKLINDSHLEAHFTVVRLRGTLRELRGRRFPFLFGRPLVATLDPSTSEVWSSRVSVGMGPWAVLCHKDKAQSPNGFFIVQVGVAGPIG